jgi:mRNA-degrading endonuclease RelE of RelBE toxin-antitoxin system
MNWATKITNKAANQLEKLPKSAKATLLLLLRDIERNGPSTSGGLILFIKKDTTL